MASKLGCPQRRANTVIMGMGVFGAQAQQPGKGIGTAYNAVDHAVDRFLKLIEIEVTAFGNLPGCDT